MSSRLSRQDGNRCLAHDEMVTEMEKENLLLSTDCADRLQRDVEVDVLVIGEAESFQREGVVAVIGY